MKFRVMAIVLIMALAASPAAALADAGMQAGAPAFTVNSTAQTVMYAGQEWYVIGCNGAGVYSQAGTATLFLKKDVYDWHTDVCFRNLGNTDYVSSPSEYLGSTLQGDMTARANAFPAKELAAVNARALTAADYTSGPDVPPQKLWPLSYDEWETIGNNPVRAYVSRYWTRSVDMSNIIWIANAEGNFMNGGNSTDYCDVRPAMNVSLSSVLFTSAATGGKSAAALGDGLAAAQAPTGPVKFTMRDSSLTLDVVASTAESTQSVSSLEFVYRNASMGANRYVSCVLTDGSGAVKYYGKLADCSGAAEGDFNVPLSGVADGAYTLKLLCEEANGDRFTDFCSAPVEMTVAVSGGVGTVSGFGGTVLSDDAGLSAVAGQAVDAAGAGTSASPRTAGISVINSVESILSADIEASNESATVELYSDAGFSENKNEALALAAGGSTHVYVKVIAEYGNALYYDVTVNRAASVYALTVVNGTGGGSYTAGTQVPVQANAAPAGKVFDKWLTGGGGAFADATMAGTVFTMPAGAVTVSAAYRDEVIAGLPAECTVYEGGRLTWDPQPGGGTWQWDKSFFSATFNSPATFTALKTGTSTITYTVNGVSQSVTVTIKGTKLPETGQPLTLAYLLCGLGLIAGVGAVLLKKGKVVA